MSVRRRLLALGMLAAAVIVVLTLVSASADAVPACTDTFTGASGGDWATSANWSAHAAPGTHDVACWAAGVTVSISSGMQTADSVQGGSLKLTGGKLTLTSTVNDSTVNSLSLDGTGALIGPAAQTVHVSANFEWGACTPACATPELDANIDQTGTGTFAVDGTGSFSGPDWLGGSITTTRPVSITNGDFESSGAETLTTTSTIDVSTVQLTGLDPSTTFICAGVLSTSGNYGFWDAGLRLTGGTTTVADNSDLQAGSITLAGGLLDDEGGIVRGGSGLSTLTITGGTLQGRGNMGNLTNVSGTVSPGDPGTSSNTLTVSGDYVQDAGGTFAETIGGTGSGFDLLQVSGSATVDGNLSITDVSGQPPEAGEAFVILTAGGSRTGAFSAVTGPAADEWVVTYPAGSVRVTAPETTTTTTTSSGTTTTGGGTTTTATTPSTPTTSTATTSAGGSATAPGPRVPVDVTLPVISGNPTPGHTLTCSTGTWTNDPTSYGDVWHEGGALVGHGGTYLVQIGDEGAAVTCTVSATNPAGTGAPATSAPTVVAEPGTLGCPAPTGRLSGTTVGRLALGFTRAHARRVLTRYNVTANDFDNFCLYGGWGIRVGYPSTAVLRSLPERERASVSARIVLALTANPYYALDGVRPGARLSAVAHRLGVGRSFHIGLNFWYFAPGTSARGVLKVRGGIIQEVGIANLPLTRGDHAAQRRFLASFTKA